MDDLRRRFAGLDRLRAPDLWNEIELRAATPSLDEAVGRLAPRIEGRPSGASPRLIVLLAATLLLVAALGTAIAVGSGILRLPLVIDPEIEPPRLPAPIVGAAGNGVIAVAKDGDILVADRPGGELRPLVAGPEDDRSPMFSPDGARLAFVRETHPGSSLMVADADGTNVVAIPLEPTDVGYWSFAPDGESLVAVGSFDGDVRAFIRPVDPSAALTVVDIELGASMLIHESGGPSFNPTNPQEVLVVGQLAPDGPRGIHVYDLATGGIRTVLEEAGGQYVFGVAWLPDGEHITYRSRTDSAFGPRVVAADGSGDQTFEALRGRVSPFSNDGNRIVASRVGPDMERQVIVPINGDGEPVWLTCNLATPSCPLDWIWSPDDSMLIGITYDEVSSPGEDGLTETYLLVDANTGQETELDWVDVGTPTWQRVTP